MSFPDFELELDYFDQKYIDRLVPEKTVLSFCDELKVGHLSQELLKVTINGDTIKIIF